MPRRRKSIAPQTEIQVLSEEIEKLRKEIKVMQQPGQISLQTDDFEHTDDPVPWQMMVHHPGDHVEAEPESPVVYYHPGDATPGHEVDAGFKKLAPAVSQRRQGVLVIKQGNSEGSSPVILAGSHPITQWSTFFSWGSGPPDFNPARVMLDSPSLKPRVMEKGVYALWGSLAIDPWASGELRYDEIFIGLAYGTQGLGSIMLGSTTTPTAYPAHRSHQIAHVNDTDMVVEKAISSILVVYDDIGANKVVDMSVYGQLNPFFSTHEIYTASLAVLHLGDI